MNTPPHDIGLVWFRRDLRLDDHAALHAALSTCQRVYCAFIFDRDILDALPDRSDRRVEFIQIALVELDSRLREVGSGLIVAHDRGAPAIAALAAQLQAGAVFAARDYEPQAVARDALAGELLAAAGRELRLVKDQVVFETDEVLTASATPFSVFTPYRNAWQRKLALDESVLEPHGRWPLAPSAQGRLAHVPAALRRAQDCPDNKPLGSEPVNGVPSLAAIGFSGTNLLDLGVMPGSSGASALLADFLERIGRYRDARDFPGVRGPSYLSVHLRFGTISIRTLARQAWQLLQSDPQAAPGAQTWLAELIWREFYFQILHHHPRVADRAFRPEYDAIEWESGPQAEALFAAFCEGRTGYPLVDAAIAQIRSSGYMHNRLRMVVASFLCKDLGIDWRRGERWFADTLIDFDLAANSGGWQWASSSGCDAQPYFRIFNPITQSQKFDPKGAFIRRYLPQLAALSDKQIHAPWELSVADQTRLGVVIGRDYPAPLVDHAQARARTLERYGVVKSRKA